MVCDPDPNKPLWNATQPLKIFFFLPPSHPATPKEMLDLLTIQRKLNSPEIAPRTGPGIS